MRLIFVTNVLNHHQAPVADEFYRLLGEDYNFIATSASPSRKGGVEDYSQRPYLINSFQSEESMRMAAELIDSADVVIIGASPDSLIRERLRRGRLTFRYGERWLKRWYNYFDYPRKFIAHTMNRGRNLHFLAASAYMASDLELLFAYPNRCYKWGYFTHVEQLDIEEVLRRKASRNMSIMWCSRMIKWKHPELAVRLAQRLKSRGVEFTMSLYGDGTQAEAVRSLCRRLAVSDVVSIHGAVTNGEVVEAMRSHHIFLFTSGRFEGWGAVVNEAMSNGCAVVTSDAVGSAPYLVRDGYNGRLFASEDLESLYSAVVELVENPQLCEEYARRAYQTLRDVWSPQSAARQFIVLAESLLEGCPIEIESGPCSRATRIKRLKMGR